MQKVLFCFMLSLFLNHTMAQKNQSLLIVEKDFFHEVYSLNGYIITEREALQATATYPEVVKMLKSARRTEFLGRLLVGVGGTALMTSIVDGTINKELLIAPALFSGLVLGGGLVVWNKAIRKTHKSVDLYNYQQPLVQKMNDKPNKYLNFGLTHNVLALTFKF